MDAALVTLLRADLLTAQYTVDRARLALAPSGTYSAWLHHDNRLWPHTGPAGSRPPPARATARETTI